MARSVNWEGVERLWECIIETRMGVDPLVHDFVVTEPPDARVRGKAHMAELLLEGFEVPRLAMRVRATIGGFSASGSVCDARCCCCCVVVGNVGCAHPPRSVSRRYM